mmetsp:Transcript_42657/g.138357  ORF Transcript_42657/g.138357 Transcript_42657/m.138357 type:complete len:306 (+) Transcript_42657:493-1410(+)
MSVSGMGLPPISRPSLARFSSRAPRIASSSACVERSSLAPACRVGASNPQCEIRIAFLRTVLDMLHQPTSVPEEGHRLLQVRHRLVEGAGRRVHVARMGIVAKYRDKEQVGLVGVGGAGRAVLEQLMQETELGGVDWVRRRPRIHGQVLRQIIGARGVVVHRPRKLCGVQQVAVHRPVRGQGQLNLASHRQIVHKDAEPPCASLLRAGAVLAAGPCALTASTDLPRRLAIPTASGDPLTAASGCLLTASADPLQLAATAAVRAINPKCAPVAEADADGAAATSRAAGRVRIVGSTPPAAAPSLRK